jgi:hypothetical protein
MTCLRLKRKYLTAPEGGAQVKPVGAEKLGRR